MNVFKCTVLMLALMVCSGCALTKMETARQLESNELVLSASLDWPGAAFMPRANANAMYGLGGADVSAHVGTTLLSVNGGVGARAYLGENFNLSLQADVMHVLTPIPFSEQRITGIALTPRLTTAVKDDGLFYGGFQSIFYGAFRHPPSGESEFEPLLAMAGLVAGIDHLSANSGLGFQAELSLMPVAASPDGFHLFVNDDGEPAALFQISLGIYYRL